MLLRGNGFYDAPASGLPIGTRERPRIAFPRGTVGTIKSTSIDFAPVADLDHQNDQFEILDCIDDVVIPLAQAVFFLSGEFFATERPGIFRQAADPLDDPLQIVLGDGIEILPD